MVRKLTSKMKRRTQMFNNYKKWTGMGRLVRAIEIRTTPSGAKVCDFTLAVNDRIKKGDKYVDDSTFIDCTAWNKTAELLERFAEAKKVLLVEGKLKADKWVDKNTGQNRQKLKISVDSFVIVGRKDSDNGDGFKPVQDNQKEMNFAQELPPADPPF